MAEVEVDELYGEAEEVGDGCWVPMVLALKWCRMFRSGMMMGDNPTLDKQSLRIAVQWSGSLGAYLFAKAIHIRVLISHSLSFKEEEEELEGMVGTGELILRIGDWGIMGGED